ncbi:hypothetical protein LPJ66_002531 [Kickxella alabastrina]|uniref:Uncharacterized protein n=1 Tax=Kickxella alabastrina TaxID=61397 RepID=A0ACC1IQ56_9FUNG|nr:hypothetical protein LPJ66_002531 [Kickxella alabastrina]
MGLQDPWLRIAIILQDPALLEGTIRDNLNPTNEYTYNERKFVVMDEATANVDTKSNQIMQKGFSCEFEDSTMLTIAHRLGTVMDSDRILVMDHSQMAEFDTPDNLLADKNSYFSQLVESIKPNQSY